MPEVGRLLSLTRQDIKTLVLQLWLRCPLVRRVPRYVPIHEAQQDPQHSPDPRVGCPVSRR